MFYDALVLYREMLTALIGALCPDLAAYTDRTTDLQDDSEQRRTVAQFALNLVHKLLQAQLDGSDGLDAAYNTDFLKSLSTNPAFVNGLLHMCKQGSVESRHGALTVLQHFLVPKIWHQVSADMRWQLISLGVTPMLIEITTSKESTAEMCKLAELSLQGFQGDVESNRLIAAFGMHPLSARMVFYSNIESRRANQDNHSK